jgi:type II secretory pathway component GspD/PulD (secretin)
MPSIVSIDGAEARFQSIQTVWITHSNDSRNAYSNVEQLSYGVDMSVVPRISFDGQVSLQIIKASVSDLTEDHDAKPRLIAHSITNTVDVPDGDYLVLGGLLQRKVRRMHNKLPIGLSNTPLGFLSGQKKAVEEEMEVLIMIRPRILHS